MNDALKQFKAYLKTLESLNWFLFVSGIVLLAVEIEAYSIANDVSPTGGHHSDIAGGIYLFVFQFYLSLVLFSSAFLTSLLLKSRNPVIDTTQALIIAIPMALISGIMAALITYISLPVATAFTPTAAILLVILGTRVKPRNANKDQFKS